jgi:hypothetical protein
MKGVALASFFLGWLALYLIASSCKRTITGTDPTTGRPVVIRDYTNCGPSCKFHVNRTLVAGSVRSCTLRLWSGYLLAFLSVLAFLLAANR